MPQELQVLQCYSCKTFQVDILKKVAKWSCKMCGDKQSVIKVFCRGNGKECRSYVQELNEKRIKSENETCSKPENSNIFVVTETKSDNECLNKTKSKWFEFIENSEDLKNTDIDDCGESTAGATKRKLISESRPSRRNVSKWAQPVSAVEVHGIETLEKDLDQINSIIRQKNSKERDLLLSTVENNVEEVGPRNEVRELNNSDREAKKSKWDEFSGGTNCFGSNTIKDEHLNNRLTNISNKTYKIDQLSDSEYHKSKNKLNQSNIFESDIYGDIDSFLEM